MASNNAEAEAFMDVFSGHLDLARRSLAGLPEHRLTSLADAARELMELAETIRDENDAVATDDELYEIGRRAYGIRPADYKNKLEGLAAERRALFEYGREFEREHRKKVEAAAKRLTVVNAALNKKLAEWPEEDDHGNG